MEVINENYILIKLEYTNSKKYNLDSYYISLMGDSDYYQIHKENVDAYNKRPDIKRQKDINKIIHFDNIPLTINTEFVNIVKRDHQRDLDNDIKYCYPIDFAEIKCVVQTYVYGDKTNKKDQVRYVNKSPGIMVLYKYMGPITLILNFLEVLRNMFKELSTKSENILQQFKHYEIILCSESNYLVDIINHNYFITFFEFTHEKADPNDFRRNLLGIERRKKGEDPNEQLGKFGVPRKNNDDFIEKVKKKRELDPDANYTYPIDFGIIKKPIILYTKEDGEHRLSNRAAGVILIYQYMGPITLVEDFREIFINTFKNDNLINQWAVFKKANEPRILIGATLKEFEGLKD